MPAISTGDMVLGSPRLPIFASVGGRGVDSSLDYGAAVQQQLGVSLRSVMARGIPRSELFVTTKLPCCPPAEQPKWCYAKGCFAPSCDGPIAEYGGGEPWLSAGARARRWLKQDLNNLGVEYVDLLLLHWECGQHRDTLATYREMERLVDSGRARAIGVSNFNMTAMERLLQSAIRHRPSAVQLELSVGSHGASETAIGADDVTLSYLQRQNITVIGYSSLGGKSGIQQALLKVSRLVSHHPYRLPVNRAPDTQALMSERSVLTPVYEPLIGHPCLVW